MIGESLYRILQKYSFIKNNKTYDFTKTILYPFIIKIISKFYKDKIDENLIIMGAHGGGLFLDDPKYIFKYLNERTDYKVFWIAKAKQVFNKLKREGYNVLPFYNLKTIRLLRKAKYIFLSHGYLDVLPIEFSSKTTVILTWHGTPIKKINLGLTDSYLYSKWGDIFRLKLKNDQYIDYLLTPSGNKRDHQILSNSFRISSEKILDLGYPKLDILFNEDLEMINKLKNYYNIPENTKQIILYCPTWRDDFELNFPFTAAELMSLNNLLEKTESIFLIKAHVFVKNINFKDYKNIKIVSKTADIQELYLITDILITDYSSTMFDFSLLNRPILLYTYDLKDYLKKRGLYYNLEEIAPGPLFFNVNDLIEGIKNIAKISKDYEEKRKKIRDRFNKYLDGKSTERLLKYLNIVYNN